jgi:hypothetical protein
MHPHLLFLPNKSKILQVQLVQKSVWETKGNDRNVGSLANIKE